MYGITNRNKEITMESGITVAVLNGANSPDARELPFEGGEQSGPDAQYSGPAGAIVQRFDGGQQAKVNANPVKTAGAQSKLGRPGKRSGRK
jgi:hypothetical protein